MANPIEKQPGTWMTLLLVLNTVYQFSAFLVDFSDAGLAEELDKKQNTVIDVGNSRFKTG